MKFTIPMGAFILALVFGFLLSAYAVEKEGLLLHTKKDEGVFLYSDSIDKKAFIKIGGDALQHSEIIFYLPVEMVPAAGKTSNDWLIEHPEYYAIIDIEGGLSNAYINEFRTSPDESIMIIVKPRSKGDH